MLHGRAGAGFVRVLLSSSCSEAFPELRSVLIVPSLPRHLSAQPATQAVGQEYTHYPPSTPSYNAVDQSKRLDPRFAPALPSTSPSSVHNRLSNQSHAGTSLLLSSFEDSVHVSHEGDHNHLVQALPVLDGNLFAASEQADAATLFTEPAAIFDEFSDYDAPIEYATSTEFDAGVSLPLDPEVASAEHLKEINGVRARSSIPLDPEHTRELYNEQLDRELQIRQESIQRYHKEFMVQNARLQGSAPVKGSRKLVSNWRPVIIDAIKEEQKAIMAGEQAKQRVVYGPFLLMLPPEELADIAIHTTLSATLLLSRHGDDDKRGAGAPVTSVANTIGRRVNERVNMLQLHKKVQQFRQHRRRSKEPFLLPADTDWTQFSDKEASKAMAAERMLMRLMRESPSKYFSRQKKRLQTASRLLLEEYQWSQKDHIMLGAKLLELVVAAAQVEHPKTHKMEPAFLHEYVSMKHQEKKRQGVINISPTAAQHLHRVREAAAILQPDYLPMVCEPKPWTAPTQGGYLTLRTSIMRTKHSRRLSARVAEAARADRLHLLYDALNALGNTPWSVNADVLGVMRQVWSDGGGFAGVPPSREHVKPPPLRRDLGFRMVSDGGQLLVTGGPPVRAERLRHNRVVGAVVKQNRELASVRATFQHRLKIAEEFQGQAAIYYPHNIDFRGRAYPIHPHLNHLGDDVCRGLLKFAEARPLGREGLDWLYVQVANHWGQGVDKRSFDERKRFAKDNLGNILGSASNPLSSRKWWADAEKPWQLLATCFEIHAALSSGRPEEFESRLPVHMDGSCNGLQHYAALGRDQEGGRAVNLLAEEAPQDVYKGVADLVARRVAADALRGHKEARLIAGQVDRKLVKQTVMTSVYGVTFVGAREQVGNRLRERGWQNPSEVYRVSKYIAKLTLDSIGELFNNAKDIMRWLGDCATVIAASNREVAWDSPVGVPSLQPYHQTPNRMVHTPLQTVAMRLPDDTPGSKVARKRQRSAFPPNYIHCLDSAHMMTTALACREAGLSFAGVHDSYWTHAGSVREMNRILRYMFVQLHEQPLLEKLLEQFKAEYPELADQFPRIPKRGDLDLQQVLRSKYFFS